MKNLFDDTTNFTAGIRLFEYEHYNEAFKVFSFGNKEGDAKCRYGLALLYHNGDGVEQNPEYAQELFDKSKDSLFELARAGDGEAAYILSRSYMGGLFLEENPDEALKWLEAAVEQEHPQAMYFLAVSLLNIPSYYTNETFPVEHNIGDGIRLLERSAQLGNYLAAEDLVYCYSKFDSYLAEDWMCEASSLNMAEGVWLDNAIDFLSKL